MHQRPAIYKEFQPDPSLSDLVKCFWFYDAGDEFDLSAHRVIPDNCIDFLFDFSDDIPTGNMFVTGMMTKPVFSSRQRILGIRFQPGYAYQALQLPLKHITDTNVDLDDVNGMWKPMKRVFDLPFDVLSLDILSKQMMSVRNKLSDTDARVVKAIEMITSTPCSIKEIALSLEISRQHLKRLFDKYVGISPKQFAKVHRVQDIVRRVKASSQINWVDEALEQGFFDQSHLHKDFRAVTGLSPRTFLLER